MAQRINPISTLLLPLLSLLLPFSGIFARLLLHTPTGLHPSLERRLIQATIPTNPIPTAPPPPPDKTTVTLLEKTIVFPSHCRATKLLVETTTSHDTIALSTATLTVNWERAPSTVTNTVTVTATPTTTTMQTVLSLLNQAQPSPYATITTTTVQPTVWNTSVVANTTIHKTHTLLHHQIVPTTVATTWIPLSKLPPWETQAFNFDDPACAAKVKDYALNAPAPRHSTVTVWWNNPTLPKGYVYVDKNGNIIGTWVGMRQESEWQRKHEEEEKQRKQAKHDHKLIKEMGGTGELDEQGRDLLRNGMKWNCDCAKKGGKGEKRIRAHPDRERPPWEDNLHPAMLQGGQGTDSETDETDFEGGD